MLSSSCCWRDGEVGQKLWNQVQPNVFDLTTEFIVKVAGADDQPLAEEGLLRSALIGANVGRGQTRDLEFAESSIARRCFRRKV